MKLVTVALIVLAAIAASALPASAETPNFYWENARTQNVMFGTTVEADDPKIAKVTVQAMTPAFVEDSTGFMVVSEDAVPGEALQRYNASAGVIYGFVGMSDAIGPGVMVILASGSTVYLFMLAAPTGVELDSDAFYDLLDSVMTRGFERASDPPGYVRSVERGDGGFGL